MANIKETEYKGLFPDRSLRSGKADAEIRWKGPNAIWSRKGPDRLNDGADPGTKWQREKGGNLIRTCGASHKKVLRYDG